MKKHLFSTLFLLLAVLSVSAQKEFSDFTYEGYGYKVLSEKERTVSLVSTTVNRSYAEIPSHVVRSSNGAQYKVVKIDKSAFQNTYISQVVFSTTIQEIEQYAFYGCNGLKALSFPVSLKSIGSCAFQNCTQLERVNFEDGLKTIGVNCFMGCSSLSDVHLPNTIEEIGSAAFMNCKKLSDINTPESLQEVGLDAFRDCDGLDDKLLYNSHLFVRYAKTNGYGFYTLPETTTKIADMAFHSCDRALRQITLPEGLIEIGKEAFLYCTKLNDAFVLPNSVKRIDNRCFTYCTFTKFYLPASVDSLGMLVFSSCDKLKDLYVESPIPATRVNRSFEGLYETCTLHVPSGAKSAYMEADEWRNFKNIDDSGLIVGSCGAEGDSVSFRFNIQTAEMTISGTGRMMDVYTLNSGETNSPWAFIKDKVKTIVIEDGVTCVGNGCFEAFNNLEEVRLPSTLDELGFGAFYLCKKLTSVNIPEGVASFEDLLFYGCESLTTFNIPSSVQRISQEAFDPRGTRIKYLHLNNLDVLSKFSTTYGALFRDVEELTIGDSIGCIPNGAVNYKEKLKKIVLGNQVSVIRSSAFAFNEGLREIIIPENVTEIQESAFYCCGFESIVLPSRVKIISDCCFQSCYRLRTVTLPSLLEEIGSSAFAFCSSLAQITIPATVTAIHPGAFNGCSSLDSLSVEDGNEVYDSRSNCNAVINTANQEVVIGCTNTIIPKDIVSIGTMAFNGSGIEDSFVIPQNIKYIATESFGGCQFLSYEENMMKYADCILVEVQDKEQSSYNIKNGTRFIHSGAFCGCMNVEEILVPEDVEGIGAYAFEGCGNMRKISLPSTTTYIEPFAFSGCDQLDDVFVSAETPCRISEDVFSFYGTLHVPVGTGDLYRNANVWKNFTIVEDVMTSIKASQLVVLPIDAFNLQGLKTTSSSKGIYIKGGKKFVGK